MPTVLGSRGAPTRVVSLRCRFWSFAASRPQQLIELRSPNRHVAASPAVTAAAVLAAVLALDVVPLFECNQLPLMQMLDRALPIPLGVIVGVSERKTRRSSFWLSLVGCSAALKTLLSGPCT